MTAHSFWSIFGGIWTYSASDYYYRMCDDEITQFNLTPRHLSTWVWSSLR